MQFKPKKGGYDLVVLYNLRLGIPFGQQHSLLKIG